MTRIVLIVFPVLSLFLFPRAITAGLAFAAALIAPPIALGIGIIADALYFVHGAASLPIGTALGVIGMAGAFFVRRFIKTRILPV